MKKILIATSNPGKFQEIGDILKEWGFQPISPKDLLLTHDVEENQPTFEGNSYKKAREFCELSGLPTIADDGGLKIDALNGEPGVKSRRWDGSDYMDDERLLNYTLEKMKGLPEKKRTAHLVTVVSLVLPNGQEFQSIEAVDGRITKKQEAAICPGYPFRSIFRIDKFNKLYVNLNDEEHAKINHRILALKNLKKFLKRI